MAEIKLTRRVKYAGDIVNGLIDAGWDFERAIQFVHNLPAAKPERPKGRWVLTAHEESCNYRWNVTAECSECGHSKGEVYAGFFPGFPKDLARDTILRCAESVKLDNFCPNCGADMRESESDGC